jgi:hypothetical protein
MKIRQLQRGGVSIFIVIFTSLIVTVITTGFVQLMVQNQQQASNNDLSQSAYDAAMAGVEDAKRLLVTLDRCERAGNNLCVNEIKDAIDKNECDTTSVRGIATPQGDSGEYMVGEPASNQAYTCVKIDPDGPSVNEKLLADNGSEVFKLSSRQAFDVIKISWFTREDLEDITGDKSATATEPSATLGRLPAASSDEWGSQSPPLLRAQLIQFKKGSLDVNQFNNNGTSNARTAFLYPQLSGSDNIKDYFISDSRRNTSTSSAPKFVRCSNSNEYICSAFLRIPRPEGVSEANLAAEREAYLQLSALYTNTSFKIELYNSAGGLSQVPFNNAQPTVDSTGRAADLFRRVKAKVSVKSPELSQPEAALYVNEDVCKNFYVTDTTSEFGTECRE